MNEVLDAGSTPATSSKNQVKPVSLASNPGGRVFLFPLVTAVPRPLSA